MATTIDVRSYYRSTASGSGDGVQMTESDARAIHHALYGQLDADANVLYGVLNELAVTGSTSPVTVDTGWAVSYGWVIKHAASGTIDVATPSVGTTGHRIVIEVDEAASPPDASIKLISSADGTSTLPALTQSAGGVWQTSLAGLTITTGGAITVTDERNYLYFATKIATAQLDNPVLPLESRQGGDASNWITPGTTDYDISSITTRAEVGTFAKAMGGTGVVFQTITFDTAFAQPPHVQCWATFPGATAPTVLAAAEPYNITTTGFDVAMQAIGSSSTDTHDFQWFAYGAA